MSYEIVSKQPPRRDEQWLNRTPLPIPGTMPNPGEDPDPDTYVPYDQVKPGLYMDETVYRLDTGDEIALSVSTRRLPNGAGMEFTGWARLIEKDGRTQLDKAGEEMELEFRHVVDAGTFARLDEKGDAQARISREIMLLMLGEPPTMVPIHVDLDAPVVEVATDTADWERNPHKAPPGTLLEPGATEAPLIGWATDLRLNASIRHALKMFQRAEPEVDVQALLGQPG